MAELAAAAPKLLEATLGPSHGAGLRRRAHGDGSAEIALERTRKSESRERTFSIDETDQEVMLESVERMARSVAEHLAGQGIAGRTVTLKIRLTPFRTFTRSRTLEEPTSDADLVSGTARELFEDFERDSAVRLLGVGVSNLRHPEQTSGPAAAAADPGEGADLEGAGPVQLGLG